MSNGIVPQDNNIILYSNELISRGITIANELINPLLVSGEILEPDEELTHIAVSKSSRYMLAAGRNLIRLWDLEKKIAIKTYNGHTGLIEALSFLSNERTAVSVDLRGKYCVWDVSSGTLLRTFEKEIEDTDCFAITPDDKYLISSGLDRVLRLWEISSGKEVRTYYKETKANYCFTSIAISPNGRIAALGDMYNKVHLWDILGWNMLMTLPGNSDYSECIKFSPDGRLIASGGRDNKIHIFEYYSGKKISTLEGHTGKVTSIDFSADSRLLLSGSTDKSVGLWDLEKNNSCHFLNWHTDAVTDVALISEAEKAYSCDSGGRVLIMKLIM